jgi:hypothetical protein
MRKIPFQFESSCSHHFMSSIASLEIRLRTAGRWERVVDGVVYVTQEARAGEGDPASGILEASQGFELPS